MKNKELMWAVGGLVLGYLAFNQISTQCSEVNVDIFRFTFTGIVGPDSCKTWFPVRYFILAVSPVVGVVAGRYLTKSK